MIISTAELEKYATRIWKNSGAFCGSSLQIDKTEDGCPSSVNFSVQGSTKAAAIDKE